MREFYDTEHIKNQSKKEKFINIIRTPIKFIDRKNIKTDRLIVVANSLYSKKIIDKAYDVNSVVIYPGIDTNKYKVSPGQVKENQVVSIGAINKLKNQEFLVDVLAKIEKGIRPTLVLVGNGRDEKYIEMIKVKAKTMGVNLKIKMNISEEEKIAELHKSKVFMYSPIGEPFGLAVEEAISSGLPILTYLRGGGYVEIMDRNNGIMLDKLNSTEWAFSLNQLLSNNLVSKYQHFNTRYAKKNLDERIMNEKIKKLIDKLI